MWLNPDYGIEGDKTINLDFLNSIIFIAVIAAMVQLVEMSLDKFSPKLILLVISVGQILFIYSSSIFENWSLFFMSLFAMAFVFGQVPINDIILSRYVPDRKRAKILSIKYVLNLSAGASVLPICSLMMQNGFEMRQIFALMSFFAVFIFLAAMLLPNQAASERLDLTTS